MRDGYLAIATTLLALAILAHALIPRYEIAFHGAEIARVDRWTGHVEGGRPANLPWVSVPSVWDEVDKVLASPPPTKK